MTLYPMICLQKTKGAITLLFLLGNILYMADRYSLRCVERGCLAIKGDSIQNVYKEKDFHKLAIQTEDTVVDYGNRLIVPGMADLHLHASQFAFRGLYMDCELLDWLDKHAFPEEMKYADMDYAAKAYSIFIDALQKSPTTRACIFTTIHTESALLLAQLLDEKGYPAYVGRVNMDRNCPEELKEPSPDTALSDTRRFIRHIQKNCQYVKPILTPRFVPSCSDALLEGLGRLSQEYSLPVQSHLSENPEEIKLAASLSDARFYGDTYDRFGLFGPEQKTVMAHCVYSGEEEIARLKENGVFIAHCPNSNISLASGIAPVRKYWEYGLSIGLGTDIAGGFSLSMFRAIQDAISVSKLYWRQDGTKKPLCFSEAFFMATMGGGAFFGKTGTFLPGYEADVVVLDDKELPCPFPLSARERLERLCYLLSEHTVSAKYIQGRLVYTQD